MTYTVTNFKSKAALIRALKAGEPIRVFQPGSFGPSVSDGKVALEGPHYPAAHTWYAQGTVSGGLLISVK